jgi:phage terminase large subunit-like protein
MNPQIFATTTPKRVPILYSLLDEAKNGGKVWISRGSTMDNAGNLSEAYISAITGVYAGTRLAAQELYGEMLDAVEGALWTEELVNNYRESTVPPYMSLRCIGVDPSVAENPRDECGIVVVGSSGERDLYKRQSWVLEDASVLGSPTVWAQRVVAMAKKWGCPVIAEVNQGGALVRNAIHTIDPTVTVLEVHSKFGKALRAEPITLAYEQGRVHHVGYFAELESQMLSWIPGEGKSPDRVDALVHALTALLIKPPAGFVGGKITARSNSSRRINLGRGARGGASAFRSR